MLPYSLAHYQILDRADADATMKHYLGGRDPGNDFALLRAEPETLRHLPPHLIIYAAHDCLRDQAQKYIDLLLSVEVPVEAYLAKGAFHSFT